MQTESQAFQIVGTVVEKAIGGAPPVITSARELANEYISDRSYDSNIDRVNSLIRWETSKNFGSGFVTGLGGLITLPIALPADMLATWIIQARMSAAIAVIGGHNPSEERVKTLVMLTLIGDAVKNILKDMGIKIANNATRKMIMKIPGKVLIEINKKVGFRLLTKAGQKGIINLIKWVPVAGGLVGGTVDAVACVSSGNIAREVFC